VDKPRPIITFTTDFGTEDPYAGIMKGVVLSICPEATIVDITHEVSPQNLVGAAFVLDTAYRYFPSTAIHVVVVDPGVGSLRRAILLETPLSRFIAPDNGVLSYILRDAGLASDHNSPVEYPSLSSIPDDYQAYNLTKEEFWLHPTSHTFHGRDIFASVSAHLANGIRPEALGDPITKLICLEIPKPHLDEKTIIGQIMHVDHFGNLVTNILAANVTENAIFEISGHRIHGLSRNYVEGPELLAIAGSHGYVEISAREASAAHTLNARPGQNVCLHET
jgi:S-adenosylmethionine hydrolase